MSIDKKQLRWVKLTRDAKGAWQVQRHSVRGRKPEGKPDPITRDSVADHGLKRRALISPSHLDSSTDDVQHGWLLPKEAVLGVDGQGEAPRAYMGTYEVHHLRCTFYNSTTKKMDYEDATSSARSGSVVLNNVKGISGWPSRFPAANGSVGGLMSSYESIIRSIEVKAVMLDLAYRTYRVRLGNKDTRDGVTYRRVQFFPSGLTREVWVWEDFLVLQEQSAPPNWLCPPHPNSYYGNVVNLDAGVDGQYGYLVVSDIYRNNNSLPLIGSEKYPPALG